MIKINLSPVRSGETLSANWQAPIITVNGTDFDLSELPDGATATHPVLGTVERTGDDYEVTLRLPHGSEQWHQNAEDQTVRASVAQKFPEPVIMNTDGDVPLPQAEIKETPNELAE